MSAASASSSRQAERRMHGREPRRAVTEWDLGAGSGPGSPATIHDIANVVDELRVPEQLQRPSTRPTVNRLRHLRDRSEILRPDLRGLNPDPTTPDSRQHFEALPRLPSASWSRSALPRLRP